MAVLQDPVDGTTQRIESYLRSGRVSLVPRGAGYSVSNITGTIGAALAANSAVFVARNAPASGFDVLIKRIFLQWTTIVAFTTPVTASRRLAIYRGSGAAASGGTAIAAAGRKSLDDGASDMDAASGGDMRISTTGALTVTGITFETPEFGTMLLVAQGAAGAYKEKIWEADAADSAPFVIRPGELVAIRNPAAMDAAGTWQLAVDMDWVRVAT